MGPVNSRKTIFISQLRPALLFPYRPSGGQKVPQESIKSEPFFKAPKLLHSLSARLVRFLRRLLTNLLVYFTRSFNIRRWRRACGHAESFPVLRPLSNAFSAPSLPYSVSRWNAKWELSSFSARTRSRKPC